MELTMTRPLTSTTRPPYMAWASHSSQLDVQECSELAQQDLRFYKALAWNSDFTSAVFVDQSKSQSQLTEEQETQAPCFREAMSNGPHISGLCACCLPGKFSFLFLINPAHQVCTSACFIPPGRPLVCFFHPLTGKVTLSCAPKHLLSCTLPATTVINDSSTLKLRGWLSIKSKKQMSKSTADAEVLCPRWTFLSFPFLLLFCSWTFVGVFPGKEMWEGCEETYVSL